MGDAIFTRRFSLKQWKPIVATGGTVTDIGNYRYHSFTSTGTSTFSVTDLGDDGTIDLLLVAGGGSGGKTSGGYGTGGGGGGGVIERTNVTVGVQNYSIVVGAGGAAQTVDNNGGFNGLNTTAFSLTALGGGVGSRNTIPSGQTTNGGSGGGAWNGGQYIVGTGLGLQPGSASGGFGNRSAIFTRDGGGGGGGAGAQGSPPSGPTEAASVGGAGGVGRSSVALFGTTFGQNGFFGAGGGGSSGTTGAGTPAAANGGGGRGGWPGNNPTSGLPNTGGGGGGAVENRTSGAGGSGIVIIRYLLVKVN